jgi:hypothetical protein
MLSRYLLLEPTPLGSLHPGEQMLLQDVEDRKSCSARSACREHCSSGMWGTARAAQQGVPAGSTALAGLGGLQELLSGERVPGINRSAVPV